MNKQRENLTQAEIQAAAIWRIVMPFVEQLEEMRGHRLPYSQIYVVYDLVEDVFANRFTEEDM